MERRKRRRSLRISHRSITSFTLLKGLFKKEAKNLFCKNSKIFKSIISYCQHILLFLTILLMLNLTICSSEPLNNNNNSELFQKELLIDVLNSTVIKQEIENLTITPNLTTDGMFVANDADVFEINETISTPTIISTNVDEDDRKIINTTHLFNLMAMENILNGTTTSPTTSISTSPPLLNITNEATLMTPEISLNLDLLTNQTTSVISISTNKLVETGKQLNSSTSGTTIIIEKENETFTSNSTTEIAPQIEIKMTNVSTKSINESSLVGSYKLEIKNDVDVIRKDDLMQLNFTAAPSSSSVDFGIVPIEPIMGNRVTAAVQIGTPPPKASTIQSINKDDNSSLLAVTNVVHFSNDQSTTIATTTTMADQKLSREKALYGLISSTSTVVLTTTTTLASKTTMETTTIPVSDQKPVNYSLLLKKSENELYSTKLNSLLEIPFEIINVKELQEYKRQLHAMLDKVEKVLNAKTKPNLTAPNKLSSLFLQRIGASTNYSPNDDEKEILRKQLQPHNSQNIKTQLPSSQAKAENLMLAAALAAAASANSRRFNPKKNYNPEECKNLTQSELVNELKQRGTYNPDLMAWDVSGVFRFLDRTIADQYEKQTKSQKNSKQFVQRNIDALERLFSELNLQCNISSPEVIARLGNLTLAEPRRSVVSPSIRLTDDETRFKRNIMVAEDLMRSFNNSKRYDNLADIKKQKIIGDVRTMPFGCDTRGDEEGGYLRLCGACQTIRRLPDNFFPTFINEVTCAEDNACLYFYDFPHGKCKQKHMNFVVLRNVGTKECQIWKKFNLNVRVSCECFVQEMSFFAKYV